MIYICSIKKYNLCHFQIYLSEFKQRNKGHFSSIVRLALADGFLPLKKKSFRQISH
jgi:hypothetical protein